MRRVPYESQVSVCICHAYCLQRQRRHPTCLVPPYPAMALSIVLAMAAMAWNLFMAWCKSVQKAMKKKKRAKARLRHVLCQSAAMRAEKHRETKKTLLAFRRCFAALGILGPSVVSCCSRFQDLSVSCWFQRCNFFVTVHFPSFRRTFWCWDCRKDLQQSVFLGAGTALDICTLNPSSLRFKIYLHCFGDVSSGS